MARMPRAIGWVLCAVLAILTIACKTANPSSLPSWIAAYPDSTPRRAGSAFVFQTKDPPEKILDFYERQLAQAGVRKEARGGGEEYGGFLAAGDDSHNRNVMIDIRLDKDKGVSEVSITVVAKK
jgi:hypothetical protein